MMQAETLSLPLRLRIEETALASNWRALDRLSGQASAGAAVKADAYGLGAARVVPVLSQAGCRDFFVAHWSEAAPLRGLAPSGSLAVLHGPMSAADAAFARQSGVRPVINSLYQARIWQESGGGLCDLMVDTGMNRLGIGLGELADPVIAGLEIDVLHSHLASSETACDTNEKQRQDWMQARSALAHRRAAIANSAGIALGNAYHGDLTRPGIALYGGIPCPALAHAIAPVAFPQAQVIQVRELRPGDTVGYNATFVAERAMVVGTVGLGYADGYLRSWSNCGAFLVNGMRVPILGRVSMDLVVADLSQTPGIGEGDWLDLDYSLVDAARISGLSQYELLTLLGQRFAR